MMPTLPALSAEMLKRRTLFLGCALLWTTLLALETYAQANGGVGSDPGDPGLGGRNEIQGRLFLPSGRHLDRRLRVRLSSVRGGESSTMTDDNGAFTFRRLVGGTYRLSVDTGKDFETASETVDIIESAPRARRDQPGQVVTVQIQLRVRQSQPNPPAVVNAALLSIPQPARELYDKALAAAQIGDHKKAVEHLQRALAIHPSFPLALNELGLQHMRLGQPDKAADAFRSALKLAPDVFVLHFNYGVLLVQQKKFAEAEAELRRAVESNETSAVAHLYRGRALIGLRRDEEAEGELLTAVRLGGDEVKIAHRYLGAIYNERRDHARAIAALETYLRLEPNAKDAAQVRQIIEDLRVQATKK
ncbi:MAG: tetratricopeptide repeat protein [Acidobacteriota bacterium]|nr:tetratricopeptide repeat protein [Acidobacteriota bacterium]